MDIVLLTFAFVILITPNGLSPTIARPSNLEWGPWHQISLCCISGRIVTHRSCGSGLWTNRGISQGSTFGVDSSSVQRVGCWGREESSGPLSGEGHPSAAVRNPVQYQGQYQYRRYRHNYRMPSASSHTKRVGARVHKADWAGWYFHRQDQPGAAGYRNDGMSQPLRNVIIGLPWRLHCWRLIQWQLRQRCSQPRLILHRKRYGRFRATSCSFQWYCRMETYERNRFCRRCHASLSVSGLRRGLGAKRWGCSRCLARYQRIRRKRHICEARAICIPSRAITRKLYFWDSFSWSSCCMLAAVPPIVRWYRPDSASNGRYLKAHWLEAFWRCRQASVWRYLCSWAACRLTRWMAWGQQGVPSSRDQRDLRRRSET